MFLSEEVVMYNKRLAERFEEQGEAVLAQKRVTAVSRAALALLFYAAAFGYLLYLTDHILAAVVFTVPLGKLMQISIFKLAARLNHSFRRG
jgi:hypothetical protein